MAKSLPSVLIQMSESTADIRRLVNGTRVIISASREAMAECDRVFAWSDKLNGPTTKIAETADGGA